MVMEKLSQMDGRQRGLNLRNPQGEPISRTDWLKQINQEIDECMKRKKHYQKFVAENPNLKVLMDLEQSKIDAKQKEIRLVNFSRRGIKDRVKAYEAAMKQQGMKGKQLQEQVAKYREALLQERRSYFDKLKGKNNAKNIAKQTSKPGFFKRIFGFLKGNKGKVGAGVAALAAAGTIVALAKGCESSTPVASSGPEISIPDTKPVEETPVQVAPPVEDAPVDDEVSTTYQPLIEIDVDGNYTTKKNDCFFKIAEKYLTDLNKQKGIEEKPSQAEIKKEAERLMRQNGYWYDENNYNSEPILYPNVKLMIEKSKINKAA